MTRPSRRTLGPRTQDQSPTDPDIVPRGDGSAANGPGSPGVGGTGGGGSPADPCMMTTFTATKFETRLISRNELRLIEPHEVAFHYDAASGLIRIERPGLAPLIYDGRLPGIGGIALAALFSVMILRGRRATPWELAKISGASTLAVEMRFIGRWCALRRAFGESGKKTPRLYLLSWPNPYCVAWNHERSFRVIEPRAYASQENERPGTGPRTFHEILRRFAQKS